MKLGEWVKTLRVNKGLTQGELARRVGVSNGYVSDLERGRIVGSVPALVKVAQALGMTFQQLLRPIYPPSVNTTGLPLGLRDLLHDPLLGEGLTDDWVILLKGVEYQGKRPSTKEDFYLIYTTLRRLM